MARRQPTPCSQATSFVWLCQEESARHAHDDRRRKPVVRAPAQAAAIVQLLGSRVRVLAELDLRDGRKARERHAYRAADDAFFRKARIEHARAAVLLLQPQRRAVHAAFGADVLTEHHELRIRGELHIQRATNGRQQVDPRGLGPRLRGNGGKDVALGRKTALLLKLSWAHALGEHVPREAGRIRLRP
jgi:hypothetical protein